MNESRHADYEALSLSAARRVDRVCDLFEQAWRAGQRPQLEEFLAQVEEPERPALWGELVLLERLHTAPDTERSTDRRSGTTTPLPSAGGQPPALKSPGPPEPELPTAIGKYRIVERLGVGGQGEVFRATHPKLCCDVAIKWARHHLPRELQQGLLEEGRILARLDDPGVVRVHDVGMHEDRPFLVFAYVPGRTLAERLRQGRPSVRQAAILTAAVAGILTRLHRQGVVHRDLKPGNILLAGGGAAADLGAPRLLDFGLASWSNGWGESGLSEQQAVCGTYRYMAPEQARGQAERIGPRTALFGLGSVLYEMLTGSPPHPGPALASAAWQARRGHIVPPRQLNQQVPRSLQRICLKALAADPEHRYSSAAEMERALRAYLRRRPVLLGATAALATLLLAGVVALTLPGPVQPAGIPAGAGFESTRFVPLRGELSVRVWSETDPDRKNLAIGKDEDALPVCNREQLRVEAALNQPAHVYLLWLDSEGMVTPLYPWNPGHRIGQKSLGCAPVLAPRDFVASPGDRQDGTAMGWRVGGKTGLDTILLLARRDPLPPTVDLATLFAKAPIARLRHPREYAVRGADENRPVEEVSVGQYRGPQAEAVAIDEPLLRFLSALRKHFPLVRAVRFAHRGND